MTVDDSSEEIFALEELFSWRRIKGDEIKGDVRAGPPGSAKSFLSGEQETFVQYTLS